jgi:hypothetical protein
MEENMKSKIIPFILFLGISWLFTACSNENPVAAKLENIDAVQAIAIANEWNYSKKEITSYVTPREVVFKSSDDKVIKKIPLPEDKMLVAVAPYINRTHT